MRPALVHFSLAGFVENHCFERDAVRSACSKYFFNSRPIATCALMIHSEHIENPRLFFERPWDLVAGNSLRATGITGSGTPSSFLLLVVRPGAPSSFLFLVAMPRAPSSFLLLVVRPGAPSSFLFLVAMPRGPSSLLLLVVRPGTPSSFLFLVAMPGTPSSLLLLVYSTARSP